jgi:MoaA/NifB/PqqE/SkfB family radical SAM enzyme
MTFWRCIEGGMYRLDRTMCRMRCVFCPTSAAPPELDPQAVTGLPTQLVLEELEQILAAAPADLKIQLTADDLTTFDGFLGILDAYRRHGRRFELDTPGLRLADEGFAAAVSKYDVYLTVSCQAASDEVYTAMTGNPRAFELVRAALTNLIRFQVPFGVNYVITAINCGSLFDIARFLLLEMGLPTFTLAHFYPEQFLLDLKPDAWDLLPSYAEVDKQLARIGALCTATDKRVQVFDVAPCQLRSRVVMNPRLLLGFVHGPRFEADSPTARYRSPECGRCVLTDQCATVSQRYIEQNPQMRFDAARVKRDLALRQRLLPPKW